MLGLRLVVAALGDEDLLLLGVVVVGLGQASEDSLAGIMDHGGLAHGLPDPPDESGSSNRPLQ